MAPTVRALLSQQEAVRLMTEGNGKIWMDGWMDEGMHVFMQSMRVNMQVCKYVSRYVSM